MSKNILVDLRSLKDMHCGFGQFSYYLGRALIDQDNQNNLTYMIPKGTVPGFGDISIETASRWKKKPFYKVSKYILPRKKYDLWHMTEQFSKFFPFHHATPMILTIHDLNFLRQKNKKKVEVYLSRVQKRADRATVITTISKFVAAELREHLDLKNKEVRVIYNGLNIANTDPAKPSFAQIEKPFLFTVGQVVPKKNFHVLIDFIINTSYNLVIAGQDSSRYATMIKDRIKNGELEDRVIVTGPIGEGNKKWLYQNCTAFLFPSLTEGFGLPILEAMSHGKPVFSSNTTSLPEIGGKYAFYWENYSPEHMLEVLLKGLEIYSNDTGLKDKIIKHSQIYSWDSSAKEYLSLYNEMLAVS